MTEQIKTYVRYIEDFMAQEHTDEVLSSERRKMLTRIQLYQHERLIHLLVTLAFAVMFLIALFMFMSVGGTGLLILAVLFLILLVPYIKHYYFLENTVQKLYTIYYKLESYE